MRNAREQRAKLLFDAAENGDVEAQRQVARRYEIGHGVPYDLGKAEYWYSKAAETGNVEAQYSLGILYLNNPGNEFEREYSGIALLEQAASGKHPLAAFELAKLYDSWGAYAEAAKWWLRAANRGVATAQMRLGNYYAQGIGVPQNYMLAHMWLNIAGSRMDAEYTNPEQPLEREECFRSRDLVAQSMTKDQVVEAQQLARDWTSPLE
jgi:TPR repeat protein